ncbi:hypothetical protein F4818DRAFT_320307 [Hypoxylon cercidicola]|nr:hypothetical protein F4818DRAFT_320307 [Hypoxylon cercidicola]
MSKPEDTRSMAGEISRQSSAAFQGPSIKAEPDDPGEGHAAITGRSHDHADFPYLRQAAEVESVEALDRFKAMGIDIVGQLVERLSRAEGSRDVNRHRKAIQNLKKLAKNPKPVLGIVGPTGHGKSSLINALLGETRLVPTNCVKACTAVVTEISWNNSNNPERCYRAEVEFISADEWLDELKNLLQDIKAASDEVAEDRIDEDPDVEVALAKVKAVYPNITKDKLVQADPETLLSDEAVREHLGDTWEVVGSKPTSFYRDVAKYISSLQKGVNLEKLEEGGNMNEEQHPMQLWPLVKVVRIYIKADVLSTGAVIVDLPGVEDSNAARAAIAAMYMEKCSAIWIVAGITRAIDNKAAQQLLSRSFKQQLNYDGNYSRVTFICSRTDEIDMGEAAEFLGLDQELGALRRKESALDDWEEENKERVENDQAREKSLESYIKELEQIEQQWSKLETRWRKGETVTTSLIPSKKRKATTSAFTASKRPKTSGLLVEGPNVEYASATDLWDCLKNDMPKFPEDIPLTEEQIRSVLDCLRRKRNTASDEKISLKEKTDAAIDAQDNLKWDIEDAHASLLSSCIRKRNEYAREAIRKDFTQGLRELDNENLQRGNPDPEEEPRDYSEIARSLPVFCVSSRAYQGLCKQLGRSERVPEGFDGIDDTQMPQLIAHAKDFAGAERLQGSKSFLNGLLQVLQSLYLWCDVRDNELAFSAEDRQHALESELESLETNLRGALDIFIQQFKDIMTDLFTALDASAAGAAPNSIEVAEGWARRRRGDGGLTCASYKATCRRYGKYTRRSSTLDFNEDLVRPIKQRLAQTWINAFQQKIPRALKEFRDVAGKHLKDFQDIVETRIQNSAQYNKHTIQSLLRTRIRTVRHIFDSFSEKIVATQRKAHRKMKPAIMVQMEGTYSACAKEIGKGCFIRMQECMTEELENNSASIFEAATDPVKKDLTNICEDLQTGIWAEFADMLEGMGRDYTNLVPTSRQTSTKSNQKVREELLELLHQVDERFQRTSEPNLESITDETESSQ